MTATPLASYYTFGYMINTPHKVLFTTFLNTTRPSSHILLFPCVINSFLMPFVCH